MLGFQAVVILEAHVLRFFVPPVLGGGEMKRAIPASVLVVLFLAQSVSAHYCEWGDPLYDSYYSAWNTLDAAEDALAVGALRL